MTATLRLSIDGNAPGVRVPVFIRSLDGEHESEVLVPIGTSATRVTLEPGRYVVEAFLPSGEMLRRFVELLDAPGDGVDITLFPSRSHEWIGLQHLLMSPMRLGAASLGSPFEALLAEPAEPTLQVLRPFEPQEGWRSDKLLQRLKSERVSKKRRPKNPPRLIANDGVLYRYEIAAHQGERNTLNALLVQLDVENILIPIPSQWKDTHRHQEATLEVVVNTATDSASVTVSDPRFAPVLGYIASGHSDLALRSLHSMPLDLLYSKMHNPFAAAAGGYVLVQSWLAGHTEDHGNEWPGWIHNLAKRFPLLPDGAILEGRVLLSSESMEERCAAIERFVEAFDQGVPLFAAGLRMLLEGLLTFEDDQVPARLRSRFEVARHHVRRWATWMDPREPFTTLRLPHDE